jgi:hypothetical protein
LFQLSKQHFGDHEHHCTESLFFYILWGGEVTFLILSVFVGIGSDWNNLSSIFNSGSAIPIATVVLFACVLGICVFQLIYFICTCGHHD